MGVDTGMERQLVSSARMTVFATVQMNARAQSAVVYYPCTNGHQDDIGERDMRHVM